MERDTLAEKITAVEAAIVTGTESSGDFALYTHGSDTYLFIHDGTSGLANTDALIQLKGVTGLSNSTLVGGDLFIADTQSTFTKRGGLPPLFFF